MLREDVSPSLWPLNDASAIGSQRHVTRIEILPLQNIRLDGETQCRVHVDRAVIEEYAGLMRSGVEFPPVIVWFDGVSYWLTDGFQRVAAASMAGRHEIASEIRLGTLSDARWCSYGSNKCHGVRRMKEDARVALQRALAHPNMSRTSNVQLAQHLGIPEATIRRWRKQISIAGDRVRYVRRGGTEYTMRVDTIGQRGDARRTKSLKELEVDLSEMKLNATDDIRSILNIIGNWVFGVASADDCLMAIDRLVKRIGQNNA